MRHAASARLTKWSMSLLLLAGFLAAIPIPLIYHSNQHTKFLHALAAAFPDRLGGDWTAHTVDGLPAFTALVRGVAETGVLDLFYVLELLILALMFFSLLALSRLAAPKAGKTMAFTAMAGAMLVIFVSDWQDDTLRGVAGQYLTHGYFQPAEFGILFLLSLVLAGSGTPWAFVVAAVPAVFHPTYIAFSALFVLVFLYERMRTQSGVPWSFLIVAIALIVVPPLDLAIRFAPSDAESFARANDILAFQRIPHHSDPAQWADWPTLRKLVLALIAVPIAPKGPVRSVLVVLLVWAVAGTGFVWLTGNAEIALAAPWRVSVVVAPVSAVLLTGRVLDLLLRRLPEEGWPRIVVALPFVGGALYFGWIGLVAKVETARNAARSEVTEFVRDTFRPGDVFLTSPAWSSLRLNAMVPVFVTWKTHPYLDTEVLEWSRRGAAAEAVFGAEEGGDAQTPLDCAALDRLADTYTVTHLAVRTPETMERPSCERLTPLFASPDGAVFRIE